MVFGDEFLHEISDDHMIVDMWLQYVFYPPLTSFAVLAHRAQSHTQQRVPTFMALGHTNCEARDMEYYMKMRFVQCMLHYDATKMSGSSVQVLFRCSQNICLGVSRCCWWKELQVRLCRLCPAPGTVAVDMPRGRKCLFG